MHTTLSPSRSTGLVTLITRLMVILAGYLLVKRYRARTATTGYSTVTTEVALNQESIVSLSPWISDMPDVPTTVFDAMATMRRSHNSMVTEINEFTMAAANSPPMYEAMERARAAAHAYLDSYLDAISTTHVVRQL